MTADLNLTVLGGRLATEPEVALEGGRRLVRLLVTVATARPTRRVDVVPVFMVERPDNTHHVDEVAGMAAGRRVWIVGRTERRAMDGPEGRRTRIEVHAEQVAGL